MRAGRLSKEQGGEASMTGVSVPRGIVSVCKLGWDTRPTRAFEQPQTSGGLASFLFFFSGGGHKISFGRAGLGRNWWPERNKTAEFLLSIKT